jgi:methylated-DNA-[protein]-cysteine S-methyltransferase
MVSNPTTFVVDRRETPIGTALLVTDAPGLLCALEWEDRASRIHRLLRLQHRAPDIVLRPGLVPRTIRDALDAYLDADLRALESIPVSLGGTAFQRRVWQALRGIAPGTTLSYGALAARIGHPDAVRAVGAANGANPLSIVLPCHRVVGATAALTGYAGGLERKRWLLAHEGVRVRGDVVEAPLASAG